MTTFYKVCATFGVRPLRCAQSRLTMELRSQSCTNAQKHASKSSVRFELLNICEDKHKRILNLKNVLKMFTKIKVLTVYNYLVVVQTLKLLCKVYKIINFGRF